MTTHNHASPMANESIPWPQIDTAELPESAPCHNDQKAKNAACAGKDPCPGVLGRPYSDLRKQLARPAKTRDADVRALFSQEKGIKKGRKAKAAEIATQEANNSDCVKKSRCHLRPYKPGAGKPGCCPGQTPHHIPPTTCFKGVAKYKKDSALCVCMEGTSQHVGSHGANHAAIDYAAKKKGLKPGKKCSIAEYNRICAEAVAAQCGCNPDCIEQQLNQSLKPTNRNIKHWDSSSDQLDDVTKGKLDAVYDAPAAPSIPG
jgi:hypothetical protein